MGDFRKITGESLPLPASQRRNRLRWWLLTLFLLLSGLALVGFIFQIDRYVMATGHVTTEEYAEVRPPVSGIIDQILVESDQIVESGDILVRLDSSQERAALQEAIAQLRKAEAEAARRRISIAEEQRKWLEAIGMLRIQLENANRQLQRARELSDRGLIPGSRLENLELQEKLLQAELESLENRDPALFEFELAVIEQDVSAWNDRVAIAEARVHDREIRAPIGGHTLRYDFVIGELVRPETVLVEIFGDQKQILQLKVDERFSSLIASGQPYEAILTPYRRAREIVFKGRVESLRNVIQGDGTRNYRIAYCTFDSGELQIPPGTTGEARIYYGHSNLWKFLLGLH